MCMGVKAVTDIQAELGLQEMPETFDSDSNEPAQQSHVQPIRRPASAKGGEGCTTEKAHAVPWGVAQGLYRGHRGYSRGVQGAYVGDAGAA